MDFRFSAKSLDANSTKVFLCLQDKKLSKAAQDFDTNHHGFLKRAIENNRFNGKKNETLTLNAPHGLESPRIILLGLGSEKDISIENLENAGGTIFPLIKGTPDKNLEVIMDDFSLNGLTPGEISSRFAYGFLLRSWSFDKYKTKGVEDRKVALKSVTFLTSEADKAEKLFASLEQVAAGVFLAREFVSEPPNVLYPASMAERLQDLTKLGIKVEVLGIEELTKLGMGALLGVAQGSIQEPKVVVLQWIGADPSEKPVAFIGKGVTFDTGGISLKPSPNMWDMKYDMAGSAVVAGLIRALAGRKAKVNAVGVVGLVENMPSGSAQRPSDIVKSMSGQTIEVLDTDAEGRLVLADILWYTQDRFKPQFMVDLATLTGAIVIALGDYFAGLFSNNNELADKIKLAGEKTGERVWSMPLDDRFEREIESDIADLKNIVLGRKAGSAMAGQFLKRFVNDTSWAHLDIAGMAWADKDLPTIAKGATAYGVRLLNELVQNYYEKQ
jgi:leucyl aminopeptidase